MNTRKSRDSELSWPFGPVVNGKARRLRSLRGQRVFDHLENRCLLAVTSTQGLPVVGVEGAVFGAPGGGVVAKFTSNDSPQPLSNFSAAIVWGDGNTTAIADIVNDPFLPGVFDVLGTNTYAEEGTYPVTVSIHDAPPLGVASDAVAASVATIADAPLTASGIGLPPVLPAGQIVAGVPTFNGTVATFTDADPAGAIADYTATINWGNGVTNNGVITGPVAGVFSVTGSQTFQVGTYPVSVFIKDVGGSSATAVTTFTITDPTPVVAPIAPALLTEIEGQAFTAPIGAFTDPNLIAPISNFSATINWGDATSSSGTISQLASGTFIVTGSHTYAEDTTGAAAHAVTFTVKDVGGSTLSGAAGAAITVDDAPLTSQGASIQAVEGNPFVGTLVATVTDSNPAATLADFTTGTGSVTINWGDGSSSTLTTVPPVVITASGSPAGVVFSITGSHTYAEEGSYQVTTTANDQGGSTTIAHGEAVVADAPLSTLALIQPVVLTDVATVFPIPQFGTPLFNGPVAIFSDGNPGATIADYKATIDWGDGTPATTGTIVALAGVATFEVTGSHTYATSGVNGGIGKYTIQTLISDVGGSKLTVTNTASVTDNPDLDHRNPQSGERQRQERRGRYYKRFAAEFLRYSVCCRDDDSRAFCSRHAVRQRQFDRDGTGRQRRHLVNHLESIDQRHLCHFRQGGRSVRPDHLTSSDDPSDPGRGYRAAGNNLPELRPFRRHLDRDLQGQPERDGPGESSPTRYRSITSRRRPCRARFTSRKMILPTSIIFSPGLPCSRRSRGGQRRLQEWPYGPGRQLQGDHRRWVPAMRESRTWPVMPWTATSTGHSPRAIDSPAATSSPTSIPSTTRYCHSSRSLTATFPPQRGSTRQRGRLKLGKPTRQPTCTPHDQGGRRERADPENGRPRREIEGVRRRPQRARRCVEGQTPHSLIVHEQGEPGCFTTQAAHRSKRVLPTLRSMGRRAQAMQHRASAPSPTIDTIRPARNDTGAYE